MRQTLMIITVAIALVACVDTDDAPECTYDVKNPGGLPLCEEPAPPPPDECGPRLANRSPAVLDLCATALDEHGVVDYQVYGAWIAANVAVGTCVPIACELPDDRCWFEDACNTGAP